MQNIVFRPFLFIWRLCIICSGGQWPPFVLCANTKQFVAANTVRRYKQSIIFITSKHFNKTNSFINAGVQWTPLRVCGIYKICFGIQFLPLPAVARLPLQVYIYFHIKQYKAKIASMPYSGIWCNSFIRVSSRIDCGGTPPTTIFNFPFLIKQKQPTALQSTV